MKHPHPFSPQLVCQQTGQRKNHHGEPARQPL